MCECIKMRISFIFFFRRLAGWLYNRLIFSFLSLFFHLARCVYVFFRPFSCIFNNGQVYARHGHESVRKLFHGHKFRPIFFSCQFYSFKKYGVQFFQTDLSYWLDFGWDFFSLTFVRYTCLFSPASKQTTRAK